MDRRQVLWQARGQRLHTQQIPEMATAGICAHYAMCIKARLGQTVPTSCYGQGNCGPPSYGPKGSSCHSFGVTRHSSVQGKPDNRHSSMVCRERTWPKCRQRQAMYVVAASATRAQPPSMINMVELAEHVRLEHFFFGLAPLYYISSTVGRSCWARRNG